VAILLISARLARKQLQIGSGVFRIWQRGPWRARGARAYNRGLGADPPAGSRGRAPGRGVSGRSPPKARTLFASECLMETANSPIFLKLGNAKYHQTLLNFAILAGKWQKRNFSYKVACKKFSWSGQRGGIAPCPLNTPLQIGANMLLIITSTSEELLKNVNFE